MNIDAGIKHLQKHLTHDIIKCNSYHIRCLQLPQTSQIFSSTIYMMTSANGNIFRVTCPLCGNSPVTRSFDVFFDLCLNKRLNKQSWGWWFETPSCSSWRHCNDNTMNVILYWTGVIYSLILANADINQILRFHGYAINTKISALTQMLRNPWFQMPFLRRKFLNLIYVWSLFLSELATDTLIQAITWCQII